MDNHLKWVKFLSDCECVMRVLSARGVDKSVFNVEYVLISLLGMNETVIDETMNMMLRSISVSRFYSNLAEADTYVSTGKGFAHAIRLLLFESQIVYGMLHAFYDLEVRGQRCNCKEQECIPCMLDGYDLANPYKLCDCGKYSCLSCNYFREKEIDDLRGMSHYEAMVAGRLGSMILLPVHSGPDVTYRKSYIIAKGIHNKLWHADGVAVYTPSLVSGNTFNDAVATFTTSSSLSKKGRA